MHWIDWVIVGVFLISMVLIGLFVPTFPYPSSFKHGDANADGNLTKDEFSEMYSRQFSGRDKNSDGVYV